MDKPTDDDEARNGLEPPPLAFIYDRHATRTTLMLDERIAKVKAHATAQGWRIGGWFVDVGDDALSDTCRPALDSLCNTMTAAGGERICLIHDWDRLSRDTTARALLRRKVALAGGWTATIDGEDDRAPVQHWPLRQIHGFGS